MQMDQLLIPFSVMKESDFLGALELYIETASSMFNLESTEDTEIDLW